jgi:O-antigen ligase
MKIRPSTFFWILAAPALFLNSLSELAPELFLPSYLRVVILLAACTGFALRRSRVVSPKLVLLPLTMLICFGFVSVLWSEDQYISLGRASFNAAALAVLFVFASRVTQEEQLSIIKNLTLVCFAVVCVASLLAYYFAPASAYFQGNFRGYFTNANALGHYILFATPICILGLLSRRRLLQMASLVCLLFLISVLLDTRSRAAFVAVAVSAVVIYFGSGKRLFSLSSLVALLPAIGIAAYLFAGYATSKYEGVDTVGTRMYLWGLHVDAIQQRPNLGWGIGINPVKFKIDGDQNYNYLSDTEKGSSYYVLIEELGAWLSFLILAVMLPFFAKRLPRLYFLIRSDRRFRADLLPLSLIAGGLVHATAESWLFSFGNPLTFIFWMCCLYLAALPGSLTSPTRTYAGRHSEAGAQP